MHGTCGAGNEAEERAEMVRTLGALAELALLGVGDADRVFPNSMVGTAQPKC